VLPAVTDLLRCPHCAAALSHSDRSLRCDSGHVFDVARQGYVSLLGGGGTAYVADTADMIAARTRVLGSAAYAPLLDAVAGAASGNVIVDVGAGTGQYLAAAVTPAAGRGVGLDLSKFAARAIARSHADVGAVVADAWQDLPIAGGVADTVLSVFAPRNSAEFARILRPGGRVVVLGPGPNHLAELIDGLGMIGQDKDKASRLDAQFGDRFELADRSDLRAVARIDRDLAVDVVMMGPAAFHSQRDDVVARARTLDEPVQITVDTTLRVYRLAR
jgi:23S rRNA (guanine745-N1)-methyltransferase